jgi:hypothetical protein
MLKRDNEVFATGCRVTCQQTLLLPQIAIKHSINRIYPNDCQEEPSPVDGTRRTLWQQAGRMASIYIRPGVSTMKSYKEIPIG